MTSVQFASRTIDLPTVRLHYVEAPADAPILLLLHGIGVDWRVWQSIGRRLQPYFHLYALDLRGHGQSEKPLHGYSLADYAADIESFLDQLELQDVTLVGSSLGGLISCVVEASTAVIPGRILVDPPLTWRPAASRALFEAILRIKSEELAPEEQSRQLSDALTEDNPKIGGLQRAYLTKTWSVVPPVVLRDMLAESAGGWLPRLLPHLETIESPVLIMRANPELGGVLMEEAAATAAAALPRGSLEYFAKAGHAIHGTRPLAFLDSVLRFTQEVQRPPTQPLPASVKA